MVLDNCPIRLRSRTFHGGSDPAANIFFLAYDPSGPQPGLSRVVGRRGAWESRVTVGNTVDQQGVETEMRRHLSLVLRVCLERATESN